jgi:hypothetical protein
MRKSTGQKRLDLPVTEGPGAIIFIPGPSKIPQVNGEL